MHIECNVTIKGQELHVHGAALHASSEVREELGAHLIRMFPVVGGPGVMFVLGADPPIGRRNEAF